MAFSRPEDLATLKRSLFALFFSFSLPNFFRRRPPFLDGNFGHFQKRKVSEMQRRDVPYTAKNESKWGADLAWTENLHHHASFSHLRSFCFAFVQIYANVFCIFNMTKNQCWQMYHRCHRSRVFFLVCNIHPKTPLSFAFLFTSSSSSLLPFPAPVPASASMMTWPLIPEIDLLFPHTGIRTHLINHDICMSLFYGL